MTAESTLETQQSADSSTYVTDTRHLYWALGALMLTMLLAALDQTIVSTALPTITSDLGGFFTEHLSWRWIFYINLPSVLRHSS